MSLALRMGKWQGLTPLSSPHPVLITGSNLVCRDVGPLTHDIPIPPLRGGEMGAPEIIHNVSPGRSGPPLTGGGGKRTAGWPLFLICILMTPILMLGCGGGGFQARPALEEANDLFCQGDYRASLEKYQQVVDEYPDAGDRVLFEMGIIHSHPGNGHKDYRKSLECFQKLVRNYPGSEYRHDSEVMIFNINNVTLKDRTIGAQQTQIESLRREIKGKEDEIVALQRKTNELERKVLDFAVKRRGVDKILIEKRERRLRLLSRDEVLKSYRIALGGNPDGPKEREGDNRTPEGTYVIDARNRDSSYHLSLHISYPNEADRKRARKLGVSPGGNIMIHGIKNGFSWLGDSHANVDWTKGCIAVTDEEIEEIYELVAIGTVVEIRP